MNFEIWPITQAARVAQLVERQAFNLNVQGSSPCSGEYVFVLFIACTCVGRFKNSRAIFF